VNNGLLEIRRLHQGTNKQIPYWIHTMKWSEDKREETTAKYVQMNTPRQNARRLVVRLKLAAAVALTQEKFTKMFLQDGLLHGMLNQTVPPGATCARDVLDGHQDFGPMTIKIY
jgi:hypothetical protein